MKRYLLTILISVFTFSLAFSLPLKSTPEDKTCLTCHTTLMQGKLAHKPVSQGCDACHKSNGQQHPQPDVKGFGMTKELPDLCYTCHTPQNTKQKVHAIVNNGKCMLCHSAHSSDNAYLIKDSPLGNICMECHDDLGLEENTSKHSPVAEGKCAECHDPHQSDNDKLLVLKGQDLCFKCHTKEKESLGLKSVHAPFANKCVICHKPHGSTEEHMLTQKMPDLCYACHDDLQAEIDESKFPHMAVKEGKSCSTCHTAHASANDSLLKVASIGPVCLSCHKDLGIAEKKYQHAVVSAGKCQECHEPHRADNKNLLKAQGTDLCLKCHDKAKEQLTLANVHPPFKNKCSICHSAHGSDVAELLNKPNTELCVGCHDDFEEPMQISRIVHGPLKDGKSCMNCHSPHASKTEKILLAEQKSLCISCHSKPIKNGNTTMSNFKQLFAKNKFQHGAIAKNGCTGCHNPHFADQANLLTTKYNGNFYTAAAKDSLALCFNCHNPELLTASSSTTATSFRNADKNLHFVHVNGPKGRSCTVCHEVHAAMNKHLLTEKIPFGEWAMQMTYTEQTNGGTCLTACHAEKAYRR